MQYTSLNEQTSATLVLPCPVIITEPQTLASEPVAMAGYDAIRFLVSLGEMEAMFLEVEIHGASERDGEYRPIGSTMEMLTFPERPAVAS